MSDYIQSLKPARYGETRAPRTRGRVGDESSIQCVNCYSKPRRTPLALPLPSGCSWTGSRRFTVTSRTPFTAQRTRARSVASSRSSSFPLLFALASAARAAMSAASAASKRSFLRRFDSSASHAPPANSATRRLWEATAFACVIAASSCANLSVSAESREKTAPAEAGVDPPSTGLAKEARGKQGKEAESQRSRDRDGLTHLNGLVGKMRWPDSLAHFSRPYRVPAQAWRHARLQQHSLHPLAVFPQTSLREDRLWHWRPWTHCLA